jgi:hypothetical protein
MIATQPKPKTCKHCGTTFHPARMMQKVCGPVCAGRLVKAEKKSEIQRTRVQREAMKTIPDLKKEAQVAFNSYVRLRDKSAPCISCGRPLAQAAIGGGFDAGHYRSTGSADHLRFNEDNCHGQCKNCNRYGAGRAVDYRLGLIQRIGLERVEALESDNSVHKWTAESLRAIKAEYLGKLKEISKTEEGH